MFLDQSVCDHLAKSKGISLFWTLACEIESWQISECVDAIHMYCYESVPKPWALGQVVPLIFIVVKETFGNQTGKVTER